MIEDRTCFFLMVCCLALGLALGWLAHEAHREGQQRREEAAPVLYWQNQSPTLRAGRVLEWWEHVTI